MSDLLILAAALDGIASGLLIYGECTPVKIEITSNLFSNVGSTLEPHITVDLGSIVSVNNSPTALASPKVNSGPPVIWINAPVAPEKSCNNT